MSNFIASCISGTFNPKTISHWEFILFIFAFWQFLSSVALSGTFSSLPSPAPPPSCLWSRRGLRTHEDWIWREKPSPPPGHKVSKIGVRFLFKQPITMHLEASKETQVYLSLFKAHTRSKFITQRSDWERIQKAVTYKGTRYTTRGEFRMESV